MQGTNFGGCANCRTCVIGYANIPSTWIRVHEGSKCDKCGHVQCKEFVIA